MPHVLAPRRSLRVQIGLFVATVLVGVVLGVAARVRAVLDIVDPGLADLFVVLSIMIPVAQLYVVLLAWRRRFVEVGHWTWMLFPLHVAWGSGLLVGITEAVPIAVGLALLDLRAAYHAREAAAL